jgi:trigger factor
MEMYLQYLGMDIAALRETYKDGAEKQVKLRLALEKITELEKIEISDEDVETELKSYADAYDMTMDKIKSLVSVDDVKADLACRKAMDIVKDTAVAGAKKAPAKKKADADADAEAPAEEKKAPAKKAPAKKKAADDAEKPAAKKPAAKKAPAKKKADAE